jgi:hypothetical protein
MYTIYIPYLMYIICKHNVYDIYIYIIYIYYIHTHLCIYIIHDIHILCIYTVRCYVNNHLSCCMCFTAFIGGITLVPLYFDESSSIFFLVSFISRPVSFIFQPVWGWMYFSSFSIMFNQYFETFLPSEQHLLVAEKGGCQAHETARRRLEVLISGPVPCEKWEISPHGYRYPVIGKRKTERLNSPRKLGTKKRSWGTWG